MGTEPKLFEGQSIKKLDRSEDLLWLQSDTQQANDLMRFNWFSNNYLGVDPDNPLHIINIRYSMLPNEINPLWGIVLDPDAGPEEHVIYQADRARSTERLSKLIEMLFGTAG